jgi:hypothetical protein
MSTTDAIFVQLPNTAVIYTILGLVIFFGGRDEQRAR